MRVQAKTDVGMVRNDNQDYFYFTTEPVGNLRNLFIVADGMGGHRAGDMASRFTVETFVSLVKSYEYTDTVTLLTEAVTQVNTLLLKKAKESEDYEGMGTTLVAATIEGNTLKVANVGDSRLYLVGDDICQVTRDHSLVEEMVLRGQLEKEEAKNHVNKNIITRAIGAGETVTPELFSVDLDPGVKILMCSDGLTNMLDDNRIEHYVKEAGSVDEAVNELIVAANNAGGKDNVTALLIDPEIGR